MGSLMEIWSGALSEFRLGEGTYGRGRGAEYARSGKVQKIEVGETAIDAKVAGQRLYATRLVIRNGRLSGRCSCPMGVQGDFCKHCVAVALVAKQQLLAGEETPSAQPADGMASARPSKKEKTAQVTQAQLRAHLMSWEKSALVDLLFKVACTEGKELEAIRFKLVAERGPDILVSHLREKLLSAAKTVAESSEDCDYGGRGRYGDDDELDNESDAAYTDADTCLKKLTGVLTTHPAQACAIRLLCEEALQVMDKQVDDDCCSENVHALVESLTALHVAAARQENPEPLAFAAKLLELDLTSPATAFGSSRKTYGRILGKPGLAEYIRLARAKWAALSDKQKREDWRLKRLVLELAEDEQNLDAVVAIKSAKLENLFDYEALAKSCCDMRRDDLAIEWLEKGLQKFTGKAGSHHRGTFNSERTFLAGLYIKAKQHERALALLWKNFEDHPYLETYRAVKAVADKLGSWTEWREKAQTHMKAHLAKVEPLAWGAARRDFAPLVEILLWEKRDGDAWAVAQSKPCNLEMLRRLAKQTAASHPEAALAAFRKIALDTLPGSGPNYDETVRRLDDWRRQLETMGRQAEFDAEIARIAVQYKTRRNLTAALRKKQWIG